jgi:predicted acylesterase/phospholipase RssA
MGDSDGMTHNEGHSPEPSARKIKLMQAELERARESMERAQRVSSHATEIRIALVMNGGVSLAVWMGGVAHELDLLRRASRGDAPESVMERDRPVFEKWQRLASTASKKVRIDVVSGTSAGGLNGLLLAAAIGRGTSLPDLRSLWKESASLNRLLSKEGALNSVLSGQKFQEQVSLALKEMNQGRFDETVTLFITSTALDGRARTFRDGFGQEFDVRDHRRIYRFKNQPGRRSWKYTQTTDGVWKFEPEEIRDFDVSNTKVLTRAARATASYPVAFEPVSELPLLNHRVWPKPSYEDPASCVMDGGVLNNAPFKPVLEEITKRRVNELKVERYLVYVVPSAARLDEEKAKGELCERVPVSTVALSALNYPQEADIRSGTEDLEQRINTSLRATREGLFGRLVNDAELEEKMRSSARMLLEEFRRSRIRAVMLDWVQASDSEVTPLSSPCELDEETLAHILRLKLAWIPSEGEGFDDVTQNRWNWGIVTAERLLQTLGHHLHQFLDQPTHALTEEQKKTLIKGARMISDNLRMTLAVKESYTRERSEKFPPEGVIGAVEAAMLGDRFFRELNIPKVIGELAFLGAETFLESLSNAGQITHWTKSYQVVSTYLAVEIHTQTFAPPAKILDELTPRFTFLRLGPDEVGPLFHEDWSAALGDRKLYGIRFRHFGAFVSDAWRKSDFTWGRLDAAHYLLPLILKEGEVIEAEKEMHQAILRAEEPDIDDPVTEMRGRLRGLVDKHDGQLLVEQDTKSLKETGDSLLRVLLKPKHGWAYFCALHLFAHPFWSWTWRLWRDKQERKPESVVPITSMAKRVLVGCLFLLLLIGVIVGGFAVWLFLAF